MVGSYPRPHWYRQQLLGRDVRVALKEAAYEEAYHDVTDVTIHEQEEAGLDIVTDKPDVLRRLRGRNRSVLLVHVRTHSWL